MENMKRIINVLTVVAVMVFAGYNVYKAQQTVVLSDVAMENVEALASDGESSGLPWRGYLLDTKNSCCSYIGSPYAECSGMYNRCK